MVVDDSSPDGTGEVADELAREFPGRVEVLHRTGTTRPRPLLHRGAAARARPHRGLRLPDGRGPVARSEVPARDGREALRGPHDLVIGSRYLHGVSVVNWPLQRIDPQHVRQPLHPRRHAAAGRRLHQRLPLLAARGAGAGCRSTRMVSDGYAFLVEMLYEAHRRGCRIGEVPIIFVERRAGPVEDVGQRDLSSRCYMPWRLVLRGGPTAADAAAVTRMRHVVVMVATSYPRFPGDSVGTFMEPIARRPRRPRPRRPRRAAVASASSTRPLAGRRRHVPPLPLRAGAVAERLRLRRRRCKADVALQLAAWAAAPLGARRRRGSDAARRARGRRRRSSTGTGSFPAARWPRWPRRGRPLVVSLHGSDVFVAERHAVARRGGAAHASAAPAGSPPAATTCATAPIALGADAGAVDGRPVRRRRRRASAPTPAARAPRPGAAGRRGRRPLVVHRGRFVEEEGLRVPDRRGAGAARAAPGAAAGDCRRRRPRGRAARPRPRGRRRRPRAASRRPARRTTSAPLAWPPPTSRSCRRSATTPATWTACRTSCWRRWRRARRWSRRRPAASARSIDRRRQRAARARARRRRPRRARSTACWPTARSGARLGARRAAGGRRRARLGAGRPSGSRPPTTARARLAAVGTAD